MIINKTGFTRKELAAECDCKYYIIDYLNNCGKLPVVRESEGPGYIRLYHPNAVNVLTDHLAKRVSKNV